MKKFLTAMICVLMVIVCALPMAGCFAEKPETDLAVAQANLDANGYEVEYIVSENVQDVIDNYGDLKSIVAEKRDDNGELISEIKIYELADEELAKIYYENLKTEVDFLKSMSETLLDHYKEILEFYEDDLTAEQKTALEEEINGYQADVEYYENTIIGISERVVWAGDADAIKATK